MILMMTASLFLVGGMGCENENSLSITDEIGQIINVFQLTHDNIVEVVHNNSKMEISLQNVKDDVTINCELADFSDNIEGRSKIRVYSYLKINNNVEIIEVASKPCGALPYKENKDNVQEVVDLINELKSAPANSKSDTYFTNSFINLFGEGVSIKNTPYKIFMAKAFPINYNQPTAKLENYKFIFILTSK